MVVVLLCELKVVDYSMQIVSGLCTGDMIY